MLQERCPFSRLVLLRDLHSEGRIESRPYENYVLLSFAWIDDNHDDILATVQHR